MPRSRKKIVTRPSTFSASVVFSNEGLPTEILLRLPVKPLVRCKCVSKRWHFLISSPHFTLLRIPCLSPARGFFLYHCSFLTNPFHKFVPFSLENPIPTPFEKFPFVEHTPRIFILQSCNGLLLCRTFQNPCTFNENYYVFNPTTHQFITLPRPGDVIGMSLAFDPLKSPHYKVICVRISDLRPENNHIDIYSSETKEWRVSVPSIPACHSVSFRHGVYWNGAVYFSCTDRFNVEQEKLEELPLPCIGRSWDFEDQRIIYFGESYGHLHLIEVSRQNLTLYNIYEMKSDGTGWFLKYKVNLEDVVSAYPRIARRYSHQPTDFHYYAMAVLTVVRGEKEEDSFLVLHIPRMAILRYNLIDKSFYMLCDLDTSDRTGVFEGYDGEFECLHFTNSSSYHYIESSYCW